MATKQELATALITLKETVSSETQGCKFRVMEFSNKREVMKHINRSHLAPFVIRTLRDIRTTINAVIAYYKVTKDE